jgi:hypothetical protein
MAITAQSTMTLLSIARAGGGLKIDAADMSAMDLVSIARASQAAKAHLTIAGSDGLSSMDMLSIARAGSGFVSFE